VTFSAVSLVFRTFRASTTAGAGVWIARQPGWRGRDDNHIVAGIERIWVALSSDEHKTYAPEVAGRDPLADSASITLKTTPPICRPPRSATRIHSSLETG